MKNKRGSIDIVCGGQYGDEGKGSIAIWLATHNRYNFSVRVGGFNAEHRFFYEGNEYTSRILPCAGVSPHMDLYLGAGHLFSVKSLKEEVKSLGINPARIFIDKNAGIVLPMHQKQSQNANRGKRGGTTGQGAGKAATHKVLRDGTFVTASMSPELQGQPFYFLPQKICSDLNMGKYGLIEGSQGALLSLNHGYYPFCCAKDVTPAGVLAEVGATLSDVRDIYAIYRAYPMRVPGKSGPTGGAEIDWEEMEVRLGRGVSKEGKMQTQSDGSKKGTERIFEWSWGDFRKSIALCGPTKMVFTFADWHHPDNLGVNKWEDLHSSTMKHISDMERVAAEILGRQVMVTLIKTGPKEEEYIAR